MSTRKRSSSDVFVIQTGCDYLVRPATLVIQDKSRIVFRNLTASPVLLFLPWGKKPQVLPLAPSGKGGDTTEADVRTLPGGVYPYAAYVEAASGFARGESDPRIIID
jgi:hypothetical protein